MAPSRQRISPRAAVAAALTAALVTTSCGSEDADPAGAPTISLAPGVLIAAAAGSGTALEVIVRDGHGKASAGATVTFAVEAGGGAVAAATATTGADGRAATTWTLGMAPVPQRLRATSGAATVAFEVDATLASPWPTADFGALDAWLAAHPKAGSTEDLAFSPDGSRLYAGITGGLVALDPAGLPRTVTLSGDPLDRALGMAFAADGTLWVADITGKALRTVTFAAGKPDAGVVATVLTEAAGSPLRAPNDVWIGGGKVWLSDPCRGEVFAVQDGQASVVGSFDLTAEGGPNGVALAKDGATLFATTENVVLLCPGAGATSELDAKLGSLWRIDLASGARTAVASGLGVFGDGLTFDADGNLYAVFDTFHLTPAVGLDASTVWVWPQGQGDPRRYLESTNKIYANIAFAPASFGLGRPYVALLAVPPVTATSARGIERL